MQIITMPVPAQDEITRDNVTVRVDAVVYFRVMNAVRAAVDVQDYLSAIERRARVIVADGELRASEKLADAAEKNLAPPIPGKVHPCGAHHR